MLGRLGATGLALKMILILGGLLAVIHLSVGWSLKQTMNFAALASFEDDYLLAIGLAIQFGPQMFMVMYKIADTPLARSVSLVGFIILTLLDAVTNIGATNALFKEKQMSGEVVSMWAYVFRYGVDVAIVFAEEIVAYGLSSLSQTLAVLLVELDFKALGWLTATQNIDFLYPSAKDIRAAVGSGSGRKNKKSGSSPQRREYASGGSQSANPARGAFSAGFSSGSTRSPRSSEPSMMRAEDTGGPSSDNPFPGGF